MPESASCADHVIFIVSVSCADVAICTTVEVGAVASRQIDVDVAVLVTPVEVSPNTVNIFSPSFNSKVLSHVDVVTIMPAVALLILIIVEDACLPPFNNIDELAVKSCHACAFAINNFMVEDDVVIVGGSSIKRGVCGVEVVEGLVEVEVSCGGGNAGASVVAGEAPFWPFGTDGLEKLPPP